MRKPSVGLLAGVVSLSWLALACGGGDGNNNIIGGPACGVGPCGGDLVGTWNAATVCIDRGVLMDDFVIEGCPEASVGAVNYTPSGTFLFNADLSYSISLTATGTFAFNYPLSCIGVTCPQFNAAIQAAFLNDPPEGIQSISCAGNDPCTCTFVTLPASSTETGTYSTSANTLVTTSTAGGVDTLDYCVKGTTVTFRDPPTSTPSEVVAFVAERP
jgi:hypothetical protein